ncbi:MAG: pentapeptide repeat-containing protein [Taibaiella sp.]|nr:pentapeptide repeat-containing protein [Taibaiella sp.]
MILHPKSIGNKISEARKKNNLSQAELAQQVSISPQAVGKWERGESMPDLSTLNQLAGILGVDLNYFSDSFRATEPGAANHEIPEGQNTRETDNFEMNWNMSQGNWVDADFSGLKNLKEKFSASNMKDCKFIDSDLSGLMLAKNNIERCDFSASNICKSKIQASNLLNNQFNNCSFVTTELLKNNIGECDFSGADFSGATITDGYFERNKLQGTLWKFTTFRNTGISDVVFEGNIENCHFENCAFYGVKFQNATILNSFFKYNRKFKKVQFIDCRVDKITYAFLKSNEADLSGVTLIPE